MARKSKSPATASEVRTWLLSDEGREAVAKAHEADAKVTTHVGDRGRLDPTHRRLFAEATGREYVVGLGSQPTIAVPTFDKRGRRTGRTVDVPSSEVRAMPGVNAKGRTPEATLLNVGRIRAGLPAEG